MAISTESVFLLLDESFDYLLVIDGEEQIAYASEMLARECRLSKEQLVGKRLDDVLTGSILEGFRHTMTRVYSGKKSGMAFWKVCEDMPSIPLRSVSAETGDGRLCLFWGNRFPDLSFEKGIASDSQVAERVKELSCIYAVADWIEVSSSVDEFFEEFPKYLRQGMQFPEHTVVYSMYHGKEYGQRPPGDNFMKSNLIVGGEIIGEIAVGYDRPDLAMLPEEQTLLDEIGRTLGLTLDRKQLMETLAAKREESEEQQAQLDTVNLYLDDIKGGFEESRVRLETMFQAIPDKMAIIDLKRNVIMTNRESVGPGQKCHKVFFGSDRPCADCRLRKIIKDKAPIVLEIKHDDEYYEVHALPIFNKQHEVDGIIEFYRDVTYKRTYEQQLQQADKLASLGQLVSGIGHEINNPNQFIRGNVKIIQQALEDMLPIVDEHFKTHPDMRIARLQYDFFRSHIMVLVNDMANGSERIKRIVEGLKRFARRDEGLLIDAVDVNTVIDESARLVHNQVHKYADIELNLAPDLPTITGNAQKIEQVLINLVINASQAMSEDRSGIITLSTHADGEYVTIVVEDNGTGMSDRTMNSIFDPFFTTKRAKGGTGLGLSIAYRIVEEHGGAMSVSSKLGVGTTFTIKIPHGRKKTTVQGRTRSGEEQ